MLYALVELLNFICRLVTEKNSETWRIRGHGIGADGSSPPCGAPTGPDPRLGTQQAKGSD